MAIAVIPLLSLLLPLAAVVVGGETTCPTPMRVSEKLAQMGVISATPSVEASHAAFLSRNAQGLLVTLRTTEHTVLAERQFSAQASCEDLAAAAAVVIASWEGELGSEGSLGLQVPLALSKPTESSAWKWDLGVAAQLGYAASSISPGAWFESSVGSNEGPLRIVVSAFWQGNHELSLGKGDALWRRTGFAVGPRFEIQRGRLLWAVEILTYGAYLQMQGRNQPQNATDAIIDAGGLADLRLGMRLGKVVPWLSLGASYSPFKRQVVIEPATIKDLPVLQLSAMAGFSWRFGDLSAN